MVQLDLNVDTSSPVRDPLELEDLFMRSTMDWLLQSRVNDEKLVSGSQLEFLEHLVQRSCGLGGRCIGTETAEAAGGRTGAGGTLNSPFMTTLAGFSLNETERNRSEDLLDPDGLVPDDNFLVPFGGFPVAFGGDGGIVRGSGADADDVNDDDDDDDVIFHFRGSVDERYGKCIVGCEIVVF